MSFAALTGGDDALRFQAVRHKQRVCCCCWCRRLFRLLQAELFLDLRVCSNPNDLFYCGDTCQTIARGIGFR